MEELIRRSDAIKAYNDNLETSEAGTMLNDAEYLRALQSIPAVEPWELYNPDEWCQDCNEYDTENHRCPRWNKVIRRTLEENQPKQGEWIKDKGQDVLLKAFIDKGEEWRVCSVCGTGHKIGERTNGHYHAYFHNYCPNCGARMKGADNEL